MLLCWAQVTTLWLLLGRYTRKSDPTTYLLAYWLSKPTYMRTSFGLPVLDLRHDLQNVMVRLPDESHDQTSLYQRQPIPLGSHPSKMVPQEHDIIDGA